MNGAQLRASLALWQRRHSYRQRKLDAAHRHNDAKGVEKWHALLVEAGKNIAHRRAQLGHAHATIDVGALRYVVPTLPPGLAAGIALDLGTAMKKEAITDPDACAFFIGQCAHESGGFNFTRELWGPSPAQRGYWSRRDLQGPGPLFPGLGYVTRGAGYIQTTGRNNFERAAQRLGVSYARLLVLANRRQYSALLAAVWWADHFPKVMHPGWDVLTVTKRVNGGTNGLASREAYTRRAMSVKARLVPR